MRSAAAGQCRRRRATATVETSASNRRQESAARGAYSTGTQSSQSPQKNHTRLGGFCDLCVQDTSCCCQLCELRGLCVSDTSCCRDCNREPRAAVGTVLGVDGSAVQLDEMPDDRKAEAGTAR